MANKKKTSTSKIVIYSVAALVIGFIAGAGGTVGVDAATNDETKNAANSESKVVVANASEGVVYDDLRINFLELGNKYAGDATYIKAGDVDILIDAGSRADSATTIKHYIDQYCTDGKLEYVIATHGHQDHIAALVGNKSTKGILDLYDIGTLVYFSQTAKQTSLINNFYTKVETLKANGSTCVKANEILSSTDDYYEYAITDQISMKILWNKYYFEQSADENDHSVISMFTYGTHNFVFTGDLEHGGEEEFATHFTGNALFPTGFKADLYKGGHHGSKTSSNDVLLDLIDPQMCCVCCCAGATEYTKYLDNTFPTQLFINRIAKHTDAVYITSMWDEENKTFTSMNGNIVVSCNGTEVAVASSNNLTKLKDTDWFTHEVYIDSTRKIVSAGTSGATATPYRQMPSQWQ